MKKYVDVLILLKFRIQRVCEKSKANKDEAENHETGEISYVLIN